MEKVLLEEGVINLRKMEHAPKKSPDADVRKHMRTDIRGNMSQQKINKAKQKRKRKK